MTLTRDEKYDALLDVLKGQPRVWLSADAVQKGYCSGRGGLRFNWRHPDYLTTIAVGQMLSRLAAAGTIAKMSNGYMGYYRWIG